ncbi:MAG TPA: hypothetical protein VIJ94_05000 [Caulobacteraceae bacterium]
MSDASVKGGWWAGLDRARQIMFLALGLMLVSQFFHYQGAYLQHGLMGIGGGGGGDHVEPDVASGVGIATTTSPIAGVTGWHLHPHAWLVLAALLAGFLLGPKLGRGWMAWGYWIGVVGLITCMFPTSLTLGPPGYGYIAGLAAIGLAIWAALVNRKALKGATTA